MKPKYHDICEVYKIFARSWEHVCDFSEEAKRAMYEFETHGKAISKSKKHNGYQLGKQYMDVTIAMWKEDYGSGLLSKYDLLNDDTFPEWWIESVVDKWPPLTLYIYRK